MNQKDVQELTDLIESGYLSDIADIVASVEEDDELVETEISHIRIESVILNKNVEEK